MAQPPSERRRLAAFIWAVQLLSAAARRFAMGTAAPLAYVRAMPAWTLRNVPLQLERAYVEAGWWTDATLGLMVARWLRATPSATVHVWSRVRPWHGTYADV